MFCPPLSLSLSAITASLLPGSLGLCSHPIWAQVGWDILPGELEQLDMGREPQGSCLPYPLDQLWPSCDQLDLLLMTLQVLSLCTQALGLLAGLLLARWLWRKAVRCQRQASACAAPGDTDRQGGSHCDSYGVLCRLEANTALMVKQLRRLCYLHVRDSGLHKPAKKRKVDDLEEEESFFSAPTSRCSRSRAPGELGE
uniref:Uncharacterized protein n=1 Tax=Nothoprocta perdicaria TaxID=30464 RepID=A0A8C6ZXH3_NOTPE